jgi:hypothetical protein
MLDVRHCRYGYCLTRKQREEARLEPALPQWCTAAPQITSWWRKLVGAGYKTEPDTAKQESKGRTE